MLVCSSDTPGPGNPAGHQADSITTGKSGHRAGVFMALKPRVLSREIIERQRPRERERRERRRDRERVRESERERERERERARERERERERKTRGRASERERERERERLLNLLMCKASGKAPLNFNTSVKCPEHPGASTLQTAPSPHHATSQAFHYLTATVFQVVESQLLSPCAV